MYIPYSYARPRDITASPIKAVIGKDGNIFMPIRPYSAGSVI